ncbi:MAG: MBL fold metallo-hydrolase [Candidatus ainarchaeum sp.]|nr:MBL fold metallo-hydrolase [Candidatus ainarchaeum sp.]
MVELQYFGHSFFKINHNKESILIDPIFNETKTNYKREKNIPVKKEDLKKISLILITNETEEHFDKDAIKEISIRNDATVIANDYILNSIDIPRNLKKSLIPNKEIQLKNVKIKPIIAHSPKCFCTTGYVVEMDNKKIYHAGITKLIDSFPAVDADIALLPISVTTMDVIDAVRVTKILKPQTVIPMQYDMFNVTTKIDPKDFKKRIEESVLNTKPIILDSGKKLNFR